MVEKQEITTKSVAEVIKQMEVDLGLLNEEAYGREARLVWEASRFDISSKIKQQSGLTGNAHSLSEHFTKMPLLRLLGYSLYVLKQSLFRNPFFAPRKPEFLVYGNPRRKMNNQGLYEDPYTDEIISHIGTHRCVIIESPYLLKHLKPTPHFVWYGEFLFLLAMLYIKVMKMPKPNFITQMSHDVEQYIQAAFGIELAIHGLLIRRQRIMQTMTKVHSALLKWNKPKKILLVCSYGKEPIVMAARNHNIPVLELQHGVISEFHLGYAMAPGQQKISFPDYLLSFGEYWRQSVTWPLPNENVMILGYPYFSREKEIYAQAEKRHQIVFFSQGTVGKRLSDLAAAFAESQSGDLQVVYKLHPGEYSRWKTEYTELYKASKKGFILVIDGDEPPLYQLLAESQWQVGVNSTVLFEGLGFNCRTLVVKLPGYEYMNQIIEQNMAILVDPEVPMPYNKAPIVNHNTDLFFKNDWIENIKNLSILE